MYARFHELQDLVPKRRQGGSSMLPKIVACLSITQVVREIIIGLLVGMHVRQTAPQQSVSDSFY